MCSFIHCLEDEWILVHLTGQLLDRTVLYCIVMYCIVTKLCIWKGPNSESWPGSLFYYLLHFLWKVKKKHLCCIKSSGFLPGVIFWCMTNVSASLVCPIFKTPKIGQTSGGETLVIHQKMTPGNNPEDFKQHYDHGGSLQLHKEHLMWR
jgi:hypothetical protein